MKRLLLGFVLVLAAILLFQWRDWRLELPGALAPDAVPEVEMASAPASPEAAPMPRPEEDYIAVLERPLFLPERRPPEDEPVEEPADEDLAAEVADLARLDVTATLILSPTEASVWVRDPDQPELVRLRLGDDYEGWTVAKIEGDRILMERQGMQETLDLLDFSRGGSGPRQLPRPARRERGEDRRGVPSQFGERQPAQAAGGPSTLPSRPPGSKGSE
jgi:hypothetical protein